MFLLAVIVQEELTIIQEALIEENTLEVIVEIIIIIDHTIHIIHIIITLLIILIEIEKNHELQKKNQHLHLQNLKNQKDRV
jgi:hypothetical protein